MDLPFSKQAQLPRLLFFYIKVFLLQDDYNIAMLATIDLSNILKIIDLDKNA